MRKENDKNRKPTVKAKSVGNSGKERSSAKKKSGKAEDYGVKSGYKAFPGGRNKPQSQAMHGYKAQRAKAAEQKSEGLNIQWYPGHMKRTERQILKVLPIVDAVAEIVDARIPVSSRNPELSGIVGELPRIILLNKCDIADKTVTDQWIEYYKSRGIIALPLDCKSGKGVDRFVSSVKTLLKDKLEAYDKKGLVGKPLRMIVVGIPNVGKSSFINRMAKMNKAVVADRPGVTRGNQWFKIDQRLELLDTPGVLWPKFEDKTVGEHLAFTGAVKDGVIDAELLAVRFLETVGSTYKENLNLRYGVVADEYDGAYELLIGIAKKRGMMLRGGEADTLRAAGMLLDEYRAGKLGNLSLERPKGE